MTKYEIYIFIDSMKDYSVAKTPNALHINVVAETPFDKISKRFNKYTHNIKYREGYKQSDYNLYIYDKSKFFVWDVLSFRYYHPRKKVISVELYYWREKFTTSPLVVGFNQEGVNETIYYTYNFLRTKQYSQGLPSPGDFRKDDLITRLTEELGLYSGSRRNQIVIKIDQKIPNTVTSIKYPKTGPNSNKVSLSKSQSSVIPYFDRFDHKIQDNFKVPSFYINIENNSFYIDDNLFKLYKLKSAEVYFSKFVNTNTPLLVGFETKSGTKKFYSVKEIENKKVADVKLRELNAIEPNNVETKLEEENDKLYPKICYLIEQKNQYSYRIKLTSEPDSSLNGFTKYTHSPLRKYLYNVALVLYCGDKLMEKKGDKLEPISYIQDSRYKTVDVYFGKKDGNFPLIIKLTTYSKQDTYYVHKRSDYLEYWEKIEIKSADENDLLNKLNSGEAQLSTSVIFLIDRQNKYSKKEIQNSPGIKLTESQPNEIEVKNLECEELKKSNFKCCESKFSPGGLNSESSSGNIILKLFMPTSDDFESNSVKYSEITLYDNSRKIKEYLKYNENQTSLYVYFYGDDPRPLLVLYENKAYIPFNQSNYYDKWFCFTNLKSFSCSNHDEVLKSVDRAKNVLYFLNPVILEQSIDKNKLKGGYVIDKYTSDSKKNEIKINIQATNLKCYRKYTHTASRGYILGEISHNGNKLFESYEEYKSILSPKYKNKFPVSASVYYYLYDMEHNYPLLIVLEFKNGLGDSISVKEYYELSDKVVYKWKKIENTSNLEEQTEIEKKLKEIRVQLEIQYENKEENLIIETSENCREDSHSGAVAGVITTLGLAGVGSGVAYYKYPDAFTSLYRRFRQWIPLTRRW